MLQNELKKQLGKATLSNQILLGAAALFLLGNIVMGTMLFQKNSTKEIITAKNLAENQDTLELADNLDNELGVFQIQQMVDSYKIVVDTLTNRLARAETANQDEAVPTSQDYVGELMQYARQFNNTDCNKSLAFLYAAKKIAQTDGTSEANKIALRSMITKCEAAMFGEKPSENMPKSSVSINK